MRALAPLVLAFTLAAQAPKGASAPTPSYRTSQPPKAWIDGVSPEALSRTVGRQALWLETEHFVIGSTLGPTSLGADSRRQETVLDEARTLRRRFRDVPKRLRTLDPALRLQLTGLRLEAHYAEFLEFMGRKQGDFPSGFQALITPMGVGPHLGREGKFRVLLLQTEGELARVRQDTLGVEGKTPLRFFHRATDCFAYYMAAECFGGALQTDEAVDADLAFHITQNFVDAWRQPGADKAPWWLREGLGHLAARRVSKAARCFSDYDTSREDELSQRRWAKRIQRMALRGTLPPITTLFDWTSNDGVATGTHMLGWAFVDHLAQSRIDVLRALIDRGATKPFADCNGSSKLRRQWHEAVFQAENIRADELWSEFAKTARTRRWLARH